MLFSFAKQTSKIISVIIALLLAPLFTQVAAANSKLDAFVNATWNFTYTETDGSKPVTYTIVCGSEFVPMATGEQILVCKANDLYRTGIIISDFDNITKGRAVVYMDTVFESGFLLDKSDDYCEAIDGVYTVSDVSGVLLPARATPVVASASCSGSATNSNDFSDKGTLISPDVWIHAEIETVEKGAIDAVWHLGGDAYTARGDRVIWGYFYASPDDVSWGNENNPDLYVKAWYDVNGRIDVNFFHVSVPNIKVYSAKANGNALSSTATLNERYVRHTYETGATQNAASINTSNEEVRMAEYQPGEIDDVNTQSLINTVEKGWIDSEVKYGGDDFTARGDRVAWGFLYANSNDVSWGSVDNPEVFIKVWWDVSGRVDINFFHVSVPDIEVSSYLTNSGGQAITATYKSTVTLDKRYTRHEYSPVSTMQ